MERSHRKSKTCNRHLKNFFKAIFFVFLFGTVSACGSNFLYNLIDNMLVRSMDQNFDLNKEQKKFLKDRLGYKLSLHRTHGIPEHVTFIKGIQGKVQKGLNKESVDWFFQDMVRQYNLIIDRFSGDFVEVLMTLQPGQIDYFEARLAEQNEKVKKRLQKSLEKPVENHPEKTIKSFEEWLGPLRDTQKKEILRLVEQMSDVSRQKENPEQDYIKRIENQRKFIKALRYERSSREKMEMALNETINPGDVFPDDESTLLITDFILKIDQLITQEQRNYFIKKLDFWVDKLDALIST